MTAKFGSFRWFVKLQDDDYAQLISHMGQKTSEFFVTNRFTTIESNNKVRHWIFSGVTVLEKADRSSLRKKFRIWKLLFRTFPSIIEQLGKYGKDTVLTVTTDELHHGIFGTQFSHFNRCAFALPTKSSVMTSFFDGFELLSAPNPKTIATTSYAEVNNRIPALLDKVKELSVAQLTAEEQYFVDQVEKTYIPEVVNSALSMKFVSGPQRTAAEKNFATQLSLIDQKLKQLLDNSSQMMLESVQNQTAFLTSSLNVTKALPVGTN